MQRAPYVVAAAVVAGPIALATQLALEPDPFAAGAAIALATGLLLFAVIAAAGLLLARGRWALHLSYGLIGSQIVLGLVLTIGPAAVAAFVLGAVALVGLTGPWLQGWIRGRASASGPGPWPMFLMLGSLALVPGVAAASPEDFEWQHTALAGLAAAAAWGYSRARPWGLWLLRLALVPAAATAMAVSPVPGAAYLALHVVLLVAAAWSREARLAVSPLLDRLYGARSPRPGPPARERPT
jgi:hypothetical protein